MKYRYILLTVETYCQRDQRFCCLTGEARTAVARPMVIIFTWVPCFSSSSHAYHPRCRDRKAAFSYFPTGL